MRSLGLGGLGVIAATAYGGAAWGLDPLPVHTATTRISATNLPASDRLALADAVARVFAEAGYRDLVTATDTRTRLQDVGPVGLACDAAECAQNVWNPLHARGVVLVRQSRTRTRVQFDVQYLNLRGEVVAHEERDEPITSWSEAIAFARAAATALALRLPAEVRGAAEAPDAAAPPPDAAASVAVPTPDPRVIVVRDPPPPPVTYSRRGWEVGVGAGLIAGGLGLTAAGLYNFGVHGTEVSDPASRTIEQRCALGASVQNTAQGTQCEGVGPVTPILLGLGIASLGAGVFLLIDGLRLRPDAPAVAGPRAWRFHASPLAQGGGLVTVTGGF